MNDLSNLVSLLLTPTAQVAVIIGLAEVVKKLGLPSRWIPLVDVALGLLIGILLDGVLLSYGVLTGAVIGLGLGLSACGLFSGVKNLSQSTGIEIDENFY